MGSIVVAVVWFLVLWAIGWAVALPLFPGVGVLALLVVGSLWVAKRYGNSRTLALGIGIGTMAFGVTNLLWR